MTEYTVTLTADELHLIESALCKECSRYRSEALHYREISQNLAAANDVSGASAALRRSGRMRAAHQTANSLLAKLDQLSK